MCVVSYVPTGAGIFLTSNRDERRGRAVAEFPYRTAALLYPRDGAAGGSWIALNKRGEAAVLLNGAYVRHAAGGLYRRSRGLVLLEIAEAEQPLSAFEHVDLQFVEPFTLVMYLASGLYECRWDGESRRRVRLAADRAYVWSSATLYDADVAADRERRFGVWRDGAGVVDRGRVLDFHRGEILNGGEVNTVSITSVFLGAGEADMKYYDLRVAAELRSVAGTLREKLDRWLIRLRSWEYWPFGIVYTPAILYWIWLSLKARSWFFFSTANPGIEYAGFLMESKHSIYVSMPAGFYPQTVYCGKGVDAATHTKAAMAAGLHFPMIAKPDIGERGMQVSLLRNACELYLYNARSRVDYLLQEYIDYPNEVGIFYYRMPGEAKGYISGMVGKELLRVVGDGSSTIEVLLLREERFRLQLSALRRQYGSKLQEIPAAGEDRLLVPFGNHSRGARFLDWSDRVTPGLEATIDDLCQQIPGFYFGRLDIRFNSWEDLCEGKNFSVIEVNGAGSEPTHMYDPKHSIFFAWKEIRRHLRLLYDISRANALREGLKPMSLRAGWKMLRDHSKHEKLIS